MGLKWNLTDEQRIHLDAHGWARTSSGEVVTQKQIDDDNANTRANEEARRQYLAGLEAQRAEERRQEEERIDQALAPRRQVEQAKWLIANPGKTVRDFERLAWPHVRVVAIAELEAERRQATTAALASTGRYSI